MKQRRWPLPGDRAVDRARQVAQSYRNALLNTDPQACHLIDQAAVNVGEEWVIPQVVQYDADDRVTVSEAALLTGRSTRWVYAWVAERRAERAHVGRDGLIRVEVGAVRQAADGVGS